VGGFSFVDHFVVSGIINCAMFDDDQLEDAIRDLLIDICEVMYRRGYEMVPVGAMMRLVGVGEDRAQQHDQDYLALDQDFLMILNNRKDHRLKEAPQGVTLH
jgi:hypothetical protein